MSELSEYQLALFKELVLSRAGLIFRNERNETISQAVWARIKATASEPSGYYELLRCSQQELDELINLLTVNETYFFRENQYLKLLVSSLVPDMLANADTPVSILSAGCSTGEEPYSIAMVLYEKYGEKARTRFRITAVDIDQVAIKTAKSALYSNYSFRGVDPQHIDRFFTEHGKNMWKLNSSISSMVNYHVQNLSVPPYPDNLKGQDVIFYRNVSIYFSRDVQYRIFGALADLLNDGGVLVVGAAETQQHNIGMLSLVKMDGLFIYQKIHGMQIKERRKSSRNSVVSEPVKKDDVRVKEHRTLVKKTADPVLSCDDSDSRRLFDVAIGFAQEKNYAKVEECLNRLLAIDHGFIPAMLLKAYAEMELGRPDETLNACSLVLEKESMNVPALLLSGIAARHMDNHEVALRFFRQCIFLDRECWPAHFYLAESVHQEGDRKRSRSGYESVLRILESGIVQGRYFPMTFNSELFLTVSKHKLSLMRKE